GVILLSLFHRHVSIGFGCITGELAEQQQVLRATNTHFGAVFALLSPSQTVSLVVLAHHIGDDGDHTEEHKAVLHEVPDGVCVERFDAWHSQTSGVAKQDAVFNMDGCYPSWPQHSQKVGRKEVHLPEKGFVVRVVPEIVV